MRKPYPTDLSGAEWTYIAPHMPAPKEHGRPRIHGPRELEGLSVEELERQRRYEAANKDRSTLRRRIDNLIASRNT
jgi:transposase